VSVLLQLGSLVIALPSIHTGGALTVEHGGVVHTFDWSLESPPAEALLQWGAFYSDCKHEVHEVTSGARITLTYNLISEAPCTPLLQVCVYSAHPMPQPTSGCSETYCPM
jgi:hypothetical protein